MRFQMGVLWMCVAAAQAMPSMGSSPTKEELATAKRWVAKHFKPVRKVAAHASKPVEPPKPGLLVLANHDRVLLNGRPDGRPLKIGNTEYKRGLLCHAVSKVTVRLPGPGKTFTCVVGIDTNAGGGSVVFSIRVKGKEVSRSGVMRCGQPGVPVSVDLDGATEFTLEAGDAGDGITCDHADWADAQALLMNGRTIRLGDLPLLTPEPRSREVSVPPFSFVYGDRSSDDLLAGCEFTESVDRLDNHRTRRTQTYTDSKTGLAVRCVIVAYDDYPTVEWTLYFKNSAAADTPILEDLQALDALLKRGSGGEFLLHHAVGSPCQVNDYQPLETLLGPNTHKRITAAGGRPTNSDLSYFNIESPGEGVIVVVGWPGQWAASFVRDSGDGLRVCAGQELTHFKLHPGEEVRTPLIILQFWKGGDWIRAQNLWRRWMVAHNLPRPGGRLVPTHYGGCFGNMLPRADEDLEQIDGWLREGVKLDYWFIDAGWYVHEGDWSRIGTWEVDTNRFPRGLREVAKHCHAKGIKFVVWFEPERATPGTWLTENHPEWILGGKNGGVVNLGNAQAWSWVLSHFDNLLTTQGIDVYRQDHNIDPLSYWRANDPEDRQGITEIGHVTGYLAYWDELLRRHPDLLIDSCASGGRRNDAETLRRSVPLLRSDYPLGAFNASGAPGQQCQTYGISLWMPFHGTGAPFSDPYTMRSSYCPAFRLGWDMRNQNMDHALLRRTVDEFRRVEKYLLGDFYPLTPYSLENNAWMAWQFDRPEIGEGCLQSFRRAGCPDEKVTLKLHGLEPKSQYALVDLDTDKPWQKSGQELMSRGIEINRTEKPGSALIIYRKT